ncbi:hypothetical protein HID58_055132, partial [Brassica napus]
RRNSFVVTLRGNNDDFSFSRNFVVNSTQICEDCFSSLIFVVKHVFSCSEAKRRTGTALITPSSSGRIAILLTCLDFGVREPDFYGAIVSIGSGKSILFIPRLPEDYAVWLREIKPLSHFKETYMVDMVYYVDEEVIQVLSEQFKGSGKPMLYHKESILVIWSK